MLRSRTIQYNLMAIFACLLWSSAFVAGKQALEHQPPLPLAGSRFLLAGLLQIPFCGSVTAPFLLLRREFVTVLLVSLFHTVYLYSTFFIGLAWVRGAEGAMMIGVGPLASALVAHMMMRDDRIQQRTLFSIILGMTGVAFVALSSNPWNPEGLKEFCGLLLLLSGAFVSAVGNVLVAKRKGGLHPIALNSAQMLLGGIILLLIALPFNGLPETDLPAGYYGNLLWLAMISATAFAIWFFLLSRIKVSRLNLWKFLIPLCGSVIAWLFIPGEHPTLPSLIGMLLIVIGIIIGQSGKYEPVTSPKRESIPGNAAR
ncbi:DMT family transporter [Pontiella agarivorans]|uniref:DMT family transporter n=1 Tax=Pontiella agarivorans TaxID=3038953 RepID=A0ABU5MZT7_9BACT|nr:DMT family transporter [Pontiella agarivorans]MDZ8119674.1 DMT family transporter [Pontiella agarivorans]